MVPNWEPTVIISKGIQFTVLASKIFLELAMKLPNTPVDLKGFKIVLTKSIDNKIDEKIWLKVDPKVSPTDPKPIRMSTMARISLVTEDVINIRGKDSVLSDAITVERNNIVVLSDPTNKIAIIIRVKSNPKKF